MYRNAIIIIGLIIALCGPARAQRSATEEWVTNRLARAFATQRVERVWSPDGTEYRDGTGGVWRVVSVPQGYWTLSVLGSEYGTATNAYYEIRTAPFDFWNSPRGFSDPTTWAYFVWHVNPENVGQGQIYVEVQGEEGTHDGFFETNQIASGSVDFATTINHTLLRLAWSNDAPTVATQHVDTVALESSLTGLASRAELAPYMTGTVLTQATSHVMAQYYDDAGCVTQQILRVGDQIFTNRWGPRLTLPDGIVTNGQSVVNFGVITNRSSTIVGGVADDYTTELLSVVDSSNNHLFRVNGIGQTSVWGNRFSLFSASIWCGLRDAPALTDYGQLGVGLTTDGGVAIYHNAYPTAKFLPDGLTVAGTNTAGVLRSQSSIILPHYGTNTTVALIFTNGTIQAWEIAQ